MRKRLYGILAALLLALFTAGGFCFAEGEKDTYSTSVEYRKLGLTDETTKKQANGQEKAELSGNGEYYVFNRMIDLTGKMSKMEQMRIGNYILASMDNLHCDLQIYIVKSLKTMGYDSADAYADANFYDANFPGGYGSERTGIFLIYENDTRIIHVVRYGNVQGLSDWGVFKARLYFEYYTYCNDYYDACYGFLMKILADISDKYIYFTPETNMMCSANFVPFQNRNVDRVLDFADILTQDEEDALREKIAQIRERLHADIIVLVTTDNDYYGHSEDDNMRFCDDFYDYGGFGYGEDREGAILFINMDPGQRNFAISVCGSLSYAITDINSPEGSDSDIERLMNQMMDPFRQGRYSEAANIYVDTMEKYIYRAYITGQAGREEDRVFDGIRYQDIKPDPDASRVVDKAEILSSSAEKKLNKSIDEIREKYGIDVLVLTGDETPNDLTVQDYLPAYFRYHGYGEGSDKRGLGILIIRNGKNYKTYLTNCGDTPSLSEAMIQRISSLMPKSIKTDRQAESAANVFVKKTRFFAKWKHIPMSAPACAGLLIGLYIILSIFGKIKKSSGKTVTKAVSAGQYIVPGSCAIRSISENHIDTRVTKTKRPEPSSSSSSYSGGRSGGHSGGGHFSSSGSHHSGGSRHF